MSELLAAIEAHRRRNPEALAVGVPGRAVSRDRLGALVDGWAAVMGGRRPLVMAALPGGPALTAVGLAAAQAGFVTAPVSPKSAPAERKGAWARLQPDVVVVPDEAHAFAEEAPPECALYALDDGGAPRHVRGPEAVPEARGRALPEAVVQVQLTSGSTGLPQALLLTAAAWDANVAQSAGFLSRFADRTVLSSMPQSHAMGGAVVLEHLSVGGEVLVAERFAPGDHVGVLRERAAVGLVASPAYLRMLLQVKVLKDLPELRHVVLGSARTDAALVARLQDALPHVSVHIRYGLSEAMGTLCRLDLDPGQGLALEGTVGAPLDGVEVADLPEEGGPLRVRTGAAAVGRLEGEQTVPLLDDEGKLDTGDLACWAESGLVLKGRASQILKPNGHRVDPGEVEAVLSEPSWVNEAVVVGVPDPLVEHRLVGVVEVGGDAPEDSAKDLLRLCRAALTSHKVPHRVVVTDQLPRTHAGKPDRRAVESMIR